MLWTSPDGKYMTCSGYHNIDRRDRQNESYVWLQRIASGSKPHSITKGLYAAWAPM